MSALASETQSQTAAETKSVAAWKYVVLALGIVVAGAAMLLASLSTTPVKRKTHVVTRGTLDITLIGSGTLESSKNTEIKCEIRGGYGGRGGQSTVTYVIPSGSFVKQGDELVRLDTKVIEETVSLGKTDTNIAKAALARAEADLAKAKVAIKGYLDGRYKSQIQSLQNQRKIALRNLDRAKTNLKSAKALFDKGYVTKLEVESSTFAVRQAELELNIKDTEIDVLSRLTKKMELETLNGQVVATSARLEGRKAGLDLEQGRLDLALEELGRCSIRAPKDGLVIYPSTAKWKDAPDIEEGASVHNNQVLLLMPDLSQMRVTFGIHESKIERVKPGMPARVTLPDRELESEVSLVAEVASPGGAWSGDAVQYDATIQLPSGQGLNPGKTAEIEILVARHENVLSIPVSAVVETEQGRFCWIEKGEETERCSLELGDSNDQFVIVNSGLSEDSIVITDPTATIERARQMLEPSIVHTVARGDMRVTLTEQGTLESAENTKIKCKVRGASTINWVIENGSRVQAGDVLLELENKQIEDYIHERTKFAYLSKDAAIGFRADATRSGLAISEYVEGQFRTQLLTLEKDLAIGEANLLNAQNSLKHAQSMAKYEYVTKLELQRREFEVKRIKSMVGAKGDEIDVLKRFTKKEQLATLKGDWEASKAAAKGHEEVLKMDEQRIVLANQEMERCVIKAERSGLVIYPTSDKWKHAPDIAEGATVHNDQVLLLMPDLSQMQVRVGIHESVVEDVKPGMLAEVAIPDGKLQGKVLSVASVARPGGVWSGNAVKYDAIIELPSVDGLKPGMSAEVRILLDELSDVLMIPQSVVTETDSGHFCWVGTPDNVSKRELQLGPSNDRFVAVESGLSEGDQVATPSRTK